MLFASDARWRGNQLFVCERGYAYFVGWVYHAGEEDFDPVNSKKRTKSGKQDKQPRGRKEERERRKISARSLSFKFQYDISGDISCLVVFVSYGFKQQLFIMRLFSLL